MSASIVFIHGMFVTPACWEEWVARFEGKGYRCSAPAWPLHERPVAEQRAKHPDPELGALSIPALVEHFARIIEGLGEPPILVGHSMGGLLVQLLVQRGLAKAGVAIDSAPPKGVASFKWSFLRSNWPVISPFVSKHKPFFMSFEQFVYTFVHTLPPDEQRAAYERHVVPESRIVGRGTLSDAAAIDFDRPHAPLLFVAGELDRIIPASLNRSNHARYKDAGSITELVEFPGRTHYIIGQPGWTEVADHVEAWLARVGAGPR
ncbi:MAG: alpha/beta hydrolase [Polyangiaceae bacterium]